MRTHMHTSMTKASPLLLNHLGFERDKIKFLRGWGIGMGGGLPQDGSTNQERTVLRPGQRAQSASWVIGAGEDHGSRAGHSLQEPSRTGLRGVKQVQFWLAGQSQSVSTWFMLLALLWISSRKFSSCSMRTRFLNLRGRESQQKSNTCRVLPLPQQVPDL